MGKGKKAYQNIKKGKTVQVGVLIGKNEGLDSLKKDIPKGGLLAPSLRKGACFGLKSKVFSR